jgi:hypothetical protein
MEDIAKLFVGIIGIIFSVYIAYVLISSLAVVTPGFLVIGALIFIAILIFAIFSIIMIFRDIF